MKHLHISFLFMRL